MLSDTLKKQIQHNYSLLLKNRDLQPRPGQKQMIAEIARSLSAIEYDESGLRTSPTAGVCVVEAGTGTGKTLAYLLAALPIAQSLDKKLVIATATVALQEQVIFKDLPDLKKHTDLDFSFALAKGRGRYLCLSKLDNLLRNETASESAMMDLYGLEVESEGAPDLVLYQDMLDRLADGKWQGDRDDWPQALEESQWRMIAVEKNQCSGNRCTHFSSCSFFRARNELQQADCIVANHDLVLSDLSLGGGVILPDPAECIYVFDEGHHLPVKGISHFAHNLRLRSTGRWLEQLDTVFARLGRSLSADAVLSEVVMEVGDTAREVRSVLHDASAVFEQFSDLAEVQNLRGASSQYTFKNGVVGPELQQISQQNSKVFSELAVELGKLHDGLRSALEGQGKQGNISREEAESWFPTVGGMLSRCEAAQALWYHLGQDDTEGMPPLARWLTFNRYGDDLETTVSCSPVIAADNLADTLWQDAYAVVLTSATLSTLGDFEFLKMRAGLPESSGFFRITSPFDYEHAGTVRVPGKGFDPSDNEAHTAAITALLPDLLENEKGSLVLFSSRRQMQDVLSSLNESFSDCILCQDDYTKQQLIDKHKKRVDAGDASVIFGLASFTEGIDLPGEYCSHVVIAKIPFAVPNDPVESTLGQWMESQGRNAFAQISLPEAALRLIQASGRLLRRESDSGTITILDQRLVTRSYGKRLLNSLPPYRRDIF